MACRIPDVAISDGNAPMGGGKQPKGRPAPRRPAARRIGATRSRRQSGGRPRRCRQLSESSGASAACEEAAQDSRPARRRPKSVDARGGRQAGRPSGRSGARPAPPARIVAGFVPTARRSAALLLGIAPLSSRCSSPPAARLRREGMAPIPRGHRPSAVLSFCHVRRRRKLIPRRRTAHA